MNVHVPKHQSHVSPTAGFPFEFGGPPTIREDPLFLSRSLPKKFMWLVSLSIHRNNSTVRVFKGLAWLQDPNAHKNLCAQA